MTIYSYNSGQLRVSRQYQSPKHTNSVPSIYNTTILLEFITACMIISFVFAYYTIF